MQSHTTGSWPHRSICVTLGSHTPDPQCPYLKTGVSNTDLTLSRSWRHAEHGCSNEGTLGHGTSPTTTMQLSSATASYRTLGQLPSGSNPDDDWTGKKNPITQVGRCLTSLPHRAGGPFDAPAPPGCAQHSCFYQSGGKPLHFNGLPNSYKYALFTERLPAIMGFGGFFGGGINEARSGQKVTDSERFSAEGTLETIISSNPLVPFSGTWTLGG